jgi:hypothetical protein
MLRTQTRSSVEAVKYTANVCLCTRSDRIIRNVRIRDKRRSEKRMDMVVITANQLFH